MVNPTLRLEDVRPITLDDLTPVELVARCPTIQGRELLVKFTTLSWDEWDKLGMAVADPKIPLTKLAENGTDLLPNPQDTVYQEQLQRAGEDRQARRVFASLERSGNVFPGDTALEKWHNLKAKGDRLLVNSLVNIIIASQVQGRADIEKLADSFPPLPLSQNGSQDMPSQPSDSG